MLFIRSTSGLSSLTKMLASTYKKDTNMSLELPQCQELVHEDDGAEKETALGRAMGHRPVTGQQWFGIERMEKGDRSKGPCSFLLFDSPHTAVAKGRGVRTGQTGSLQHPTAATTSTTACPSRERQLFALVFA